MRNPFRKLFALLLCAGMLFALLPSFAAAEDEKPDEPAIELPELGDAEPAEEPAETESVPAEPEDGDTTMPELPINGPDDAPGVVLEEEMSQTGITEFPITEPGVTVYRPFTPETEGFYELIVYPGTTLGIVADSEWNNLEAVRSEKPFVTYYLLAGESYYVGVYFESPERTGTASVSVRYYSPDACGNGSRWSFDAETGTLCLSGSGDMWHYTPETVPWAAVREQIKTLRVTSNGPLNIGRYAFYGCSNLESVDGVNNIGYIYAYAFYGTALREMAWTNYSYTGIGAYAFAYCKNLKTFSVSRNNWMYEIGDHAFYGSGLETASFGYELTKVGSYAFAECKDLKTVSLPNECHSYTYNTEFGDYVFQNSGLQSFTIPKIVTEIGSGTFAGCKNLTSLSVNPKNTVYTVKDGLLLTMNGRTLISAPYQTASGAYTTPTGIRIVADAAFCGCAALSELTLSPGIVSVGADAFEGCSQMTDVSIPLTLTEIKSGAFSDCGVTDVYYAGTEANRNAKLTIASEGNDALLSAEWHYTEPSSFDGTVEWDESVQFKGTTPYLVCTGEPLTPGFALKTADGEPVDPATYSVEYRENVNAGTAYVFVTFAEGYTGTMRLFFKIYLPPTTRTIVQNKSDGIYLSWEAVQGADGYVIYRRAWSSTTNGWTDFARWNNTTDLNWTDTAVYAGTRYQYGVKAYFNRKIDPVTGAEIGGNVGDNFNLGEVGPLKTTVRITTRKLTSLAAGYNKITAKWEGSSKFTGYQIRYATDEAFTKNVNTIKITDPQTTKAVIESLAKKTPYYVSVRSYHVFEGMTYFGEWSNIIRVKTGSGQTVYDVMYRALVIGESNYSQNPLSGCVNDMKAMRGMLKGLNRPFEVNAKANAKKSEIISGIRSTFADAMDNDVSLFYYSGHGVKASGVSDSEYNRMQGALVSVDMQYITMAELAQELSKVRGRVIVILDSCHSGASIMPTGGEEDDLQAFYADVIDAFSAYDLETSGSDGEKAGELKQSKFIVIAAARINQSSYEGKYDGSGYAQGAFTAALIKGMGCRYLYGTYTGSMPADKDKDKKVTLKELYTYAYSQAGSWANQDAVHYGPDDEVLFAR